MSGIDKVISYRMIYPLQHLSLLIMAILLLPLCSVETKAESYYIVNPNLPIDNSTEFIYKTPNMSEWLMLSPVAGSTTKFEILLPAYYPAQQLLSNINTSVDDNLMNSFTNSGPLSRDGFTFVIASKSQIEEIAYRNLISPRKNTSKVPATDANGNIIYKDGKVTYKDVIEYPNVNDIKKQFLCPYMKSGDNYLVYDKKNTISGKLANYNPQKEALRQWEIRLPKKESYSKSDFKINSYFGGTKPNSTESDWSQVNYMQYIGDDALDGAYKLVIDVENNTWEMTYDSSTRVGYLAMIPAAGDNIEPNVKQTWWTYSDYQSYATYTFTQSKNKDGNFDNIYYNPAVYLEGGTKRLIYFSNSQADWNSDHAISNSVEKNKYTDLDNAMIDAIDVRDPINFLYSGPSRSGVTFNYPSDTNPLVSFWGHKMNKDTPLGENPLSVDGCYYKLKWYPYVTGPGVVKIGDGNSSDDDKPKFSRVFLKSTKGVSAYSDGYKYVAVKNDIELTHDWDRDLYYVTLSKDNFLFKYDKSGNVKESYNGQLYFQGADADGNFLTDYTWMDDGTDNNNPTEVNPDYLYQTNEDGFNANINNDKQHLSKYQANNKNTSTFTIYFKLVENGVEKPRYWVELNKPIQIPITYNCGYYVRTFSDDVAYDLPSDVCAYQVNSFNVFDNNTTDGSGNKTYTATTGLSIMKYIPKNTGVVLRDKKAETDNDGRNLIHYITLTPGSTKDIEYSDNLLVPTVKRTIIGPSVFNASGKRTARNYLFGRRSYTDIGCNWVDGKAIDYLGFFRAKDNSVSGYNKAYLQVPATGDWDKYVQLANETSIINTNGDSSAKGIMLSFDDADDSVTGISEVTSEVNNNDESYYTLTGIKVTDPSGGIYIHNGKKIYIK